MKTLNEYLNEAYKPKASDDHKALVFNMLTNEYKANNDKIMQALSDSDDKFFTNLVKDYTTFVLGYFGAGDETAEKVKKEAQEGVTAFKATVKLGMHEGATTGNKTITEFINESSNYKVKVNQQDIINVPKNTVVFAVYEGNGDELEIWTPQDDDIMAEMLMRKFDYSSDAMGDAKKVLKLTSGETLDCAKLSADKNSTNGYKITAIK